ncbi:MAG: hypothetical protein M1470_12785 [Bacteroidetes bacterium]|nr:hypothetical protein [Bacteroidota bacterium]MCL5738865.1 hypothetical protein [Bacteroidota bacterium]
MKKAFSGVFMLTALIAGVLTLHGSDFACTVLGIPNAANMCTEADEVVRATAIKYIRRPASQFLTNGVPHSKIDFHVEQVLKGDSTLHNLILNGYLSDRDDFNDTPVPYKIVRPNGRTGSCFANTYKRGAQFLLFLKRSKDVKMPGITTRFTVNFAPAAPVNEQLHSANDPWLYYIEGVLDGLKGPKMLHK